MMSLLLVTAARAEGFKEGQWKMTMNTKMDNMPPEMANAIILGVRCLSAASGKSFFSATRKKRFQRLSNRFAR